MAITWTRDQKVGRSLPVTDYYPLLARAAGALDRNTVTARRVLYARARIAQAGELRKLNPPLAEQEITRERLALEDAIRKLEAEAARLEARPGAALWTRLRAIGWRLRDGLDR